MWAKYGKSFSDQMAWVDPSTREAPAANPHARRLAALAALGVKFAVCNRSTRAYTNGAARRTGAKNEEVLAELTSNTVGPSRFVPAGVIAVTRAQERGYANISIG
jgi:intracellular sulfur oxidation DsrE/DsrF family protein